MAHGHIEPLRIFATRFGEADSDVALNVARKVAALLTVSSVVLRLALRAAVADAKAARAKHRRPIQRLVASMASHKADRGYEDESDRVKPETDIQCVQVDQPGDRRSWRS